MQADPLELRLRQAAGLSQIAFETPSRPRSWTNAARRSTSTSACRQPARPAASAQLRYAARVPHQSTAT